MSCHLSTPNLGFFHDTGISLKATPPSLRLDAHEHVAAIPRFARWTKPIVTPPSDKLPQRGSRLSGLSSGSEITPSVWKLGGCSPYRCFLMRTSISVAGLLPVRARIAGSRYPVSSVTWGLVPLLTPLLCHTRCHLSTPSLKFLKIRDAGHPPTVHSERVLPRPDCSKGKGPPDKAEPKAIGKDGSMSA